MYAEAMELLVKASQLHDQGYLAEAKTLYNQVLTLDPNTFEAKRLLGVIYRQMGDPTAAIACLEHVIRDHKDLKDEQKALVFTHLSTAYFDLNLHQEVVNSARQATTLNPELGNAWNNLGASLKAMGKSNESIKAFQKALEVEPGYLRPLNNLAEAYQESGNPQEAERIYRQLLEQQPDNHGAVIGLATVLRSMGRQQEAYKLLLECLNKDPENVELVRSMAGFRNWKMGPEHREKLEELVNTSGYDPKRKEVLLFLLAEDANKKQDLAKAVHWYRKANEFKASKLHYNPKIHANMWEKIQGLFKGSFVKQLRSFWPEPRGMADPEWQPVFIMGLPRSGTTLLNQVLASHPEIDTVGELVPGFSQTLDRLPKWQGFLKGEISFAEAGEKLLSSQVRYTLSSEYRKCQRAAGKDGGTIVDKLPGNALYLPLIGMALPRARIILTKRNLRDVALSCYQQNFAHGQSFSFDFERIKHFFDFYRRLISLWLDLFENRFITVCYEDLVNDFENQAKRIVDFAGHTWSDKCLNFYKAGSVVRTASIEQVRNPIYADSVGRWRRYVDYLPELLELPEE